jgi:hypothetical protein
MMNQVSRNGAWVREELLHLLTLSGTLAGLCITGVTLFHTMDVSTYKTTFADDILAITALLFLICTYVIFFALCTEREALALLLNKLVDILFLLALTCMVASGFIMMFTFL